jgi:hypothetical protein
MGTTWIIRMEAGDSKAAVAVEGAQVSPSATLVPLNLILCVDVPAFFGLGPCRRPRSEQVILVASRFDCL